MLDQNIHHVKKIVKGKTKELGGTYYRRLYITNDKGTLEIALFGDSLDELAIVEDNDR